jgi:tRNA(Arg) A34 adenosine deaminase TadA
MMEADRSAPGPAEECFSLLLDRARRAGGVGNYAIAAALVVRAAEGELVVVGQNTLFRDRDPAGHAEMNAIRAAQRLGAATPAERADLVVEGERDGWLLFRDDRGGEPGSTLYATLEPCPMCTVCILNSGIDRVVIAVEDPPSGTLATERLAGLPSIWGAIAARLDVVWAQSTDPGQRSSYVPADLKDALVAAFIDSRGRLDGELLSDGALDRRSLEELIRVRLGSRAIR